MTTQQQEQTRAYFKQHAEDWRAKAVAAEQRAVNVVQQRNGFVLQVIRQRMLGQTAPDTQTAAEPQAAVETQAALDVGCGTGDLVCDIARMGIDATGVDFAEEMVQIAQQRARQAGLSGARFVCGSIFDVDIGYGRYDVVSANGFIEYISPHELDRFLHLTYQALRPGGSLVVGSRNRLFNIGSLNAFTLEEIDQGTLAPLVQEATALSQGISLAQLATWPAAPLQELDTTHPATGGVAVATRYQFTPAQLIQRVRSHGLVDQQLYPVHIHAVPAAIKEQHPEIHARVSLLLQNYAQQTLGLLPVASTFMLHAIKRAS